METRQSEKSVESRDEGQAPPALQPDRKLRFRIVKLEERIAPGNANGHFIASQVANVSGRGRSDWWKKLDSNTWLSQIASSSRTTA